MSTNIKDEICDEDMQTPQSAQDQVEISKKNDPASEQLIQNKNTPHSYQLPFGGITIVFQTLPIDKTALVKLKKWIDLCEDDFARSSDNENRPIEEQDNEVKNELG